MEGKSAIFLFSKPSKGVSTNTNSTGSNRGVPLSILTYSTPPFVYGQHQSCDIFSCIYILYPAYGQDNIVLSSFLII